MLLCFLSFFLRVRLIISQKVIRGFAEGGEVTCLLLPPPRRKSRTPVASITSSYRHAFISSTTSSASSCDHQTLCSTNLGTACPWQSTASLSYTEYPRQWSRASQCRRLPGGCPQSSPAGLSRFHVPSLSKFFGSNYNIHLHDPTPGFQTDLKATFVTVSRSSRRARASDRRTRLSSWRVVTGGPSVPAEFFRRSR